MAAPEEVAAGFSCPWKTGVVLVINTLFVMALLFYSHAGLDASARLSASPQDVRRWPVIESTDYRVVGRSLGSRDQVLVPGKRKRVKLWDYMYESRSRNESHFLQRHRRKYGSSMPPLTTGIADPYEIRRKFVDNLPKQPNKSTCEYYKRKYRGDYNMLLRLQIAETPSPPRIFCLIYTHQKHHKSHASVVANTWLPFCDGAVLFSDLTDMTIPTFKIDHHGEEAYHNMWQKVRAMWAYTYEHYFEDFEYFLAGGDDMYVIVDNMRHYLRNEQHKWQGDNRETEKPIFLGHRFKLMGNEKTPFHSGGSGYVLNRAALEVVMSAMDTNDCHANMREASEDVAIADCLRKAGGILASDTRDDQGREYWLPFTPAMHNAFRKANIPKTDWYYKYSYDLNEGYNCCNPKSVSFHYLPGEHMQAIHSLLYECRKQTPDKRQLLAWPQPQNQSFVTTFDLLFVL